MSGICQVPAHRAHEVVRVGHGDVEPVCRVACEVRTVREDTDVRGDGVDFEAVERVVGGDVVTCAEQ